MTISQPGFWPEHTSSNTSPAGPGPTEPPDVEWDRAGVEVAGHDVEQLDLRVTGGWLTLRRPYGSGRILVPPPPDLRPTCGTCWDGVLSNGDPCSVCDRWPEQAPPRRQQQHGWPTVVSPITGRRIVDHTRLSMTPVECAECWDGLLARSSWPSDYGGAQPPDMHLRLDGDPCDGLVPCPHGLPPSEHDCV